MQIAVLTFEGFNEIDSFVAASILNRLRPEGWAAHITSPTPTVTSMNGVIVERQKPIEFAREADAVIVGSGRRTREIAQDKDLLGRLGLDPSRQLIGAQCSGALLLARLGLLQDVPACTDMITKPCVVEAGVEVLDAPFFAAGNVATAGGCMASQYLAAWIMLRGAGEANAAKALRYVAPVGEQDAFLEHALGIVRQSRAGRQSGSRELADAGAES